MNETQIKGIGLGIVIVALLVILLTLEVRPQTEQAKGSTISDGLIMIAYEPNEFGLATNPEQILVKAYIPPCVGDFNYCLYYIGKNYENTNFESAGLRVLKRTDLANERLCLDTPPQGFTNLPSVHLKSSGTAGASVFDNISGAAAGHYANGALYRLFVRNPAMCYEFQLQIGETRYENYPEGSIKKFSSEDLEKVKTDLEKLLNDISVAGQKNFFRQ